ncbi:MAG TPA: DUF6340 family protein [Bacteroidales bacterium]|jgi:hypothetical protein|nr:DUF6340 family protein [Bacteroidales bacterium]
MKKLLIILSVSVLAISCKTNELWLSVVEPAPVTLRPAIKKIGVIDRTLPTDQAKPLDVVDKVLTLEGANLDKDAAAESVKGLTEELMNNQRFTEVKPVTNTAFRTVNTMDFPVPLSWEIVDRICSESGLDALFSLEKFDTDTKISYATQKVDVIKTPLGNVPGIEHRADMETVVKTGWRIYDPASRTMPDQFLYNESIVFHSKGLNPVLAAGGLINRKDAVKEVSNKAGHGYALRIIPFETRVMRDYYVKGNDSFKMAMRKARTGNWDAAGEIWKKETGNPNMKIAGRATYNMAIISEINGDIKTALDYARKSYEDYNIKLGMRYVNILENRQYKNEVVDIQQQQ